jgi:Peptidase A4 family
VGRHGRLAIVLTFACAIALGLSASATGTDPVAMASTNWSGYIIDGGPFIVVTATFNVPNLTAAPETTATSEWVGIDGLDSGDRSLIQAGVSETYLPATNRVNLHAWWEILPALETPVALPVHVGDLVTITIARLTNARWQIAIDNVTEHRRFVTTRAYDGPGRSADWIVEAPSDRNFRTRTLGHFVPDVTFRNVRLAGAQRVVHPVTMMQRGAVVSHASPMTPRGFRVSYG